MRAGDIAIVKSAYQDGNWYVPMGAMGVVVEVQNYSYRIRNLEMDCVIPSSKVREADNREVRGALANLYMGNAFMRPPLR